MSGLSQWAGCKTSGAFSEGGGHIPQNMPYLQALGLQGPKYVAADLPKP